MTQTLRGAACLVALGCLSLPLRADDLRGADSLLCTSVKVVRCTAAQACEGGPPWNMDIPQFVQLDLAAKMLSTTAASAEQRSTPIQSMMRENGMIVLQGVENARAWSFMIVEETGLLSAAIARDGITVSVFGACTPVG